MGVTGLLPFLKDSFRKCNLEEFSGCTVAIDGYCWLHRGAKQFETLGPESSLRPYIEYCLKYISLLIQHRIKPIVVLDGRNLPSKEKEEQLRREKRDENWILARQQLEDGDVTKAWKSLIKSVDVTPSMARQLIKALRRLKIDHVVSCYEGDSQLAYLSKQGIADVVITEDSDLILFGCQKIIYKLDMNGDGDFFEQSKILASLDIKPELYSFEKFRWMCILSGCDYLASIPVIGLAFAKQIVFSTTEQDIKKIIESIPIVLPRIQRVPDGYVEDFLRADNTFLYQLVFNTMAKKVVPLTPYPDGLSPEELGYAGHQEDEKLELELALGNVDIDSFIHVDVFDPMASGYSSESIWSPAFVPKVFGHDAGTLTKRDISNTFKRQLNDFFIGSSKNVCTATRIEVKDLIVVKSCKSELMFRVSSQPASFKSAAGNPVFKFNAMDATGEVGCICFNTAATTISKIIEFNKIYTISGFDVKEKDARYPSNTSSPYSITAWAEAVIEPVTEPSDFPLIRFNFKPVLNIHYEDGLASIDVLGIITKVYPVVEFMSKSKKMIKKRSFELLDEQRTKITVFVLGETRVSQFDGMEDKPVALSKAQIVKPLDEDKHLSLGFEALFWINPVLPNNQASVIVDWYLGEYKSSDV